MIRDRFDNAYSRQKSYADNRKRIFEFKVGDQEDITHERGDVVW